MAKQLPTGFKTVRADGSTWAKKADGEGGSPWRQLADGVKHSRAPAGATNPGGPLDPGEPQSHPWHHLARRHDLDGHLPSAETHPVNVDIDFEGNTDSKPVLSWMDATGQERNSYTKRFHTERARAHHAISKTLGSKIEKAHSALLAADDDVSHAAAVVLKTGHHPKQIASLDAANHFIEGEHSVFAIQHPRGHVSKMRLHSPETTKRLTDKFEGPVFQGATEETIRAKLAEHGLGDHDHAVIRHHAATRIATDFLSKTEPVRFDGGDFHMTMDQIEANLHEASEHIREHFGHAAPVPDGMSFVPPHVVAAYVEEAGGSKHFGENAFKKAGQTKAKETVEEHAERRETKVKKGADVKTPEDEAVWARAKKQVEQEHGEAKNKWALVNFLYKKMKGGKPKKVKKSCSSTTEAETSSTTPMPTTSEPLATKPSSAKRMRVLKSKMPTLSLQPSLGATSSEPSALPEGQAQQVAKAIDLLEQSRLQAEKREVQQAVDKVMGPPPPVADGGAGLREKLVGVYRMAVSRARHAQQFDALAKAGVLLAEGDYGSALSLISEAAEEPAQPVQKSADNPGGTSTIGAHPGPQGDPVGTVRRRANGDEYRKTEQGWRRIGSGKKKGDSGPQKQHQGVNLEVAIKRITELRAKYRATTSQAVKQELKREIIVQRERIRRLRTEAGTQAPSEQAARGKHDEVTKSLQRMTATSVHVRADLDPLERWAATQTQSRYDGFVRFVKSLHVEQPDQVLMAIALDFAPTDVREEARRYSDAYGHAGLRSFIAQVLGV